MPDRFRPALGVVLAIGAPLLAACGHTSTTTSNTVSASSPGAATRAQFVARAEAVCHALTAQERPLRARQESLKGLAPAAAQTTFVSLARQVVALSRATAGELEALPRPAADRAAIEKLLRAYSEETADVSNLAEAAAHQDAALGEQAQRVLKRSIAANIELASTFGMKSCLGSE